MPIGRRWIVGAIRRRYNASPMPPRTGRSHTFERRRGNRRGAPRHDPRPLLLASGLSPSDVATLLEPYGLRDAKRADANLQSMAGDPQARQLLATLLADLLEAVGQTADPDQALDQWERFLHDGVSRVHLFGYLSQAPRILHLLCRIFGDSLALAQTLVRDPMLVYWLGEDKILGKRPSVPEWEQTLQAMLRNVQAVELKFEALRRFRRREMLRIGIRDLLRLADVVQTTEALSDLAGVLIQAAYKIAREDLQQRYGTPMHRGRTGRLIESGFAVIAMGKLGGGELNYSSDVDLIYVYETDDGATVSKQGSSISNEEFFEYLARDLTRVLADVTQEGYVFRVDLRLRAEGSVGRLTRSIEGYRQYYRTRGQGWERLALLKAWPVGGDRRVGRAFLRMVQPFVYVSPPGRSDVQLLHEVRGIKEAIDRKIAWRGETTRNVKLGTGGIREIEFIVQAIQVVHGARLPGIRERNTLTALRRFRRYRLLSGDEGRLLVEAYRFLRDVEHKLQMVHDLQTHALPSTPDEIARCAVRLGYGRRDRQPGARLLSDHSRYTGNVHRLFQSFFYGRQSPLLGAARKLAGKSK